MLFISGTLFHIQTVANICTWELPSATATFFFYWGALQELLEMRLGVGDTQVRLLLMAWVPN